MAPFERVRPAADDAAEEEQPFTLHERNEQSQRSANVRRLHVQASVSAGALLELVADIFAVRMWCIDGAASSGDGGWRCDPLVIAGISDFHFVASGTGAFRGRSMELR